MNSDPPIAETRLPRSLLGATGFARSAVDAFIEAARERAIEVHSLMVVEDGAVVAEEWWHPHRASQPHMLYSVSKSWLATAVGIAASEGLLSLDDEVLSFFPSYATPEVVANIGSMQLRHLLTMTSGHSIDTSILLRSQPADDWVRLFLETPVSLPPGVHFQYNSGASYLLAAIVRARSGRSVVDFLTPRLFEPLGIPVPEWDRSPRGIELGWKGLWLTTESVAKLGQLYLQRGTWNGTRLLPEAWVDEASSAQVPTSPGQGEWSEGYGFQFWRSSPVGSYRMDGAFGQFCLVLPAQNAVIAITAGDEKNDAVLELALEFVLPALSGTSDFVPNSLSQVAPSIAVPEYLAELPADARLLADALSGTPIELPSNLHGARSITLSFAPRSLTATILSTDGAAASFEARDDRWMPGAEIVLATGDLRPVPTSNAGGWLDAGTVELRQIMLGTPYTRVWRFHVAEAPERVVVEVDVLPHPWFTTTESLNAIA